MFASLYRTIERKSDRYGELQRILLGGWQSQSGVPVTWKTALECVTVLACARVIAEGIAQVPCKLYREQGGTKNPATEHPLYDLLHRRPNDWQTSFEFREQIALHLTVARNAYVFINRVRGQVAELLPLQPGWVTVKQGQTLGDIRYTVTWNSDGSTTEVPRGNLWHLRGLSWDGIQGLDGVKLAREAIGLSTAMERHSGKLFANGTKASGVLQTEQTLSAEKAKEFRDQWAENYAGIENSGKTPLLHSGFKWSAVAMNNEQAQLVESRRFQVEQICSAMRVLPIMVGYSDKTATYASAEQMFLAHVIHTLGPWIERIEQSADINLLTKAERQAGYYTHFVTAGLLRGDIKGRGEYYSRALGAGGGPAWMSQDEVRRLEELNPMGGDAARLPIPSNVGTQAAP